MRHSSLNSFLAGTTSAEELWQEIEAEVTECLTATSKLGGVGHVSITDGPPTLVTRHHVDRLLKRLADGRLPLRSASYIADALIMSDDFELADDAVSEALIRLSDESATLTDEEVEMVRSRLSKAG